MLQRYLRNMNTLSESDMALLSEKKVAVVGCGGLGGFLIEYLCRIGVGSLIVADPDRFDESNLNRQLLADSASLGCGKAEAAKKRATLVNPGVNFTALPIAINVENGPELLKGADLIMDAVDTIPARLALQETAELLNIPLIHGAVAGWYAQVSTILPGDRTFDHIYGKNPEASQRDRGIEKELGNLSFGPALTAALQTAEAIKVLLNRGERLGRKLLVADLLENDFEVVELDQT